VEANEALADVPWDNDEDSIDEELNQADTNNVLEEIDRAGVYSTGQVYILTLPTFLL
jgi:hypothetical protein